MASSDSPDRCVGLDFGTTNSAVAVAINAHAVLAEFETPAGMSNTFPSLVYFDRRRHSSGIRVSAHAGSDAVSQYLQAEDKGRLMQSLKAYLGDRRFERTRVFASTYALADLIALIIKPMLSSASRPVRMPTNRVVVGRPVHFSSAASEDDDNFALRRLLGAVRQCGFDEILVEFEPVAAAYSYERRLDRDELILIGDFGGGTSDFSLMRVGPTVRRRGRTRDDILGNDGVPVAGDAFDKAIVRHLVSPRLGLGSEYCAPPDKMLPVPSWPYERLERWHHLSFLNNDDHLDLLERTRRRASSPRQIEAFIDLIRNEAGYQLHEAVRRTKFALSSQVEARFEFTTGDAVIAETVTRAEFERWIEPELTAIACCVDGMVAKTGVPPSDIDHVFLTGGSAFVPAVRRIFVDRFGDSKITGGEELTSVATGLALRAAEHWTGN